MRGSARAGRRSSLVILGNQGVVGDQKHEEFEYPSISSGTHAAQPLLLLPPGPMLDWPQNALSGCGSKSCGSKSCSPASQPQTHTTHCVMLPMWFCAGGGALGESCRRLWCWCVWSPNGHKVSTGALKCATGGAHDAGSMRQQHHECLHTERHAWRTLFMLFCACQGPTRARLGADKGLD